MWNKYWLAWFGGETRLATFLNKRFLPLPSYTPVPLGWWVEGDANR